jgi:hypothetical protein
VGALVGTLSSGTVTGCHIDGGDVSADTAVGGVVGENLYGLITNSSSSCRVRGYDSLAGGIVGASGGSISACYSAGEVLGGDYAGGLVGWNYFGRISNCYSTAEVSGYDSVGGLVGYNMREIYTSYSIGSVIGDSNVGGLVGYNFDIIGTVISSFWNIHTSGILESDGGTPKTTAELKTRATFTSAGWDFLVVWYICDHTNYPRLTWQTRLLGDVVCPYGVDIDDLAALLEQWLWVRLSADIVPPGGDAFVNFFDWAPFAAAWQSTPSSPNWNPDCDIAPEGGNDKIDGGDILLFFQQWLQFGPTYADIVPAGGDGIVNLFDYAALADGWLQGM